MKCPAAAAAPHLDFEMWETMNHGSRASRVCASNAGLVTSRSTAKERDSESGNDYFGARYYASAMGRFLSPDWSAKEEPVWGGCMRLLTAIKATFGKRSGIMLKIILPVFAVLLISSVGLHIYSRNAADRALSVLTEAALIKVGDSEETVLPLIARHGGTKWYPESAVADSASYSYDIKQSPFQVFSKGDGALAYVMAYMPNHLRDFLGLRNWLVVVGIHIQNGRVISVNGSAFVEGGNRWFGNSWHKLAGIDEESKPYSIEMSFLNIAQSGGSGLDESFTPTASHDQEQISYAINRSCFTGLIPCSTLCDFKPSLFGYLKAHPEIRGNFDTNYCRVP